MINGISCSFSFGQTPDIYNEKLQKVDYDSLLTLKQTLVFVTQTFCIGCVEYFSKQDISQNYVYVIDRLSIVEMNRVKLIQSKASSSSFFIVGDFKIDNLSNTSRSPVMVIKRDGQGIVYDYSTLNELTDGFSLKGKSAKKKLKI